MGSAKEKGGKACDVVGIGGRSEGRRIISGDDVGTESNWRKEGPDAGQREEGRGMQNGKSIGCTNETTHN